MNNIIFPRALWLIFLLGISQFNVLGQSDLDRLAQKNFERAQELIKKKQWADAEVALIKVIESEKDWLQPRITLAAIYFDQKKWGLSRKYFESVLEADSTANPMIFFKLGEIEWQEEHYEKVVNYMSSLLTKERIKPSVLSAAEKYRRDATFLLQDSIPVYSTNVELLPPTINTGSMEYLPSFPAREDMMIFTRRVNGQEDFYLSRYIEGEWQNSIPLSDLNTQENEGAHCLSSDGKMLIFTACNRRDGLGSCDLYYSRFDGDRWSVPSNLGPTVNTRHWDGQPSLSSNGKTLYFSSDRPGGKGGRDLWKIDRKGGGWDKPVNLEALNTKGNEEVPFVHAADESLYFMSDGWPGFGASDLFLSHKVDGHWETPHNLGKPINTSEQEGALHVNLSGTRAYFARTLESPDNKPQIDIYSFDLPMAIRPLPATYANIQIMDGKTKKPLQAIVEMVNLFSSTIFTKQLTDRQGELLVCIPVDVEYAVNITKEGYVFHSEHIEVHRQTSLIEPIEFTIFLNPVEEKPDTTTAPTVLHNVFFESGSAALLEKSDFELNKLYNLLLTNPDLKIEIRGHTDNVGSDTDNQILSEQRARAINDYLLAKGIEQRRMEYRGYGETFPVADNDSDAGRQKNRRTEFLILGNGKK
ncbi:MAG: OmpA family protein [Saprospiraceae bacterium]|nr:OmpA family protein [Saprospiraceae bacterium]